MPNYSGSGGMVFEWNIAKHETTSIRQTRQGDGALSNLHQMFSNAFCSAKSMSALRSTYSSKFR